MKKIFLFIILIFLLGCQFNKDNCDRLVISCEKIYYYYDNDEEITYYYYLFNIDNCKNKDLILKRNSMKEDNIDNNFETLELEFINSGDTLKSNFVDSWFMFNKDFVLWKKKTNKVIYYLETYKNKSIDKKIYIKSLNDLYNDTLYYNKNLDTLQQKMSIEEALLLMKN